MADKTITTVVPQDTDDQFDLQLRATKSLADLRALQVGGTSGLVGGGKDVSTTGTLMAANATRKLFWIQNRGVNPLTVTMGSTQIELKGAAILGDGSGGFYPDQLWKGVVTITGTAPRYNWAEY